MDDDKHTNKQTNKQTKKQGHQCTAKGIGTMTGIEYLKFIEETEVCFLFPDQLNIWGGFFSSFWPKTAFLKGLQNGERGRGKNRKVSGSSLCRSDPHGAGA